MLCREAANTNYTCSLRFDQTGDITSDLWSPIALKAIMFPITPKQFMSSKNIWASLMKTRTKVIALKPMYLQRDEDNAMP
jgi:hypothetical protein